MLVLGVDLGTGGARAIVLDADDGNVLARASSPVALHHPVAGASEQNPNDWWMAACSAIGTAIADAGCSGDDIKAVGLTGQMHGCTLVDANNAPIRPAILWNDQRSMEQCAHLLSIRADAHWRTVCGKPPMAGLTLPSLCWVRDNEPEAFQRATGLLLPKDYLRMCLTGDRATDVGDASGTMLLDLASRQWSTDLLDALDLPPHLLPPVHESHAVTGTVTAEAAMATGLAAGTRVVAGGGDQQTGALACGITKPGSVSLNLGTSGVLFGATNIPSDTPRKGLHAFCHGVPETWHVMGVMLSAGGALRWWRDITGASYDELTAEAASVEPGAEGVLFRPYLSGERTPHEDASLSAAFNGVRLHHGREHLTRAVFEGIAFGLRDGFDLVTGGESPNTLRFTGGASGHAFWRQLIADVMVCPVATVNIDDGSAFGAALLGAVGAGCFTDVHEACKTLVNEASQTTPTSDRHLDAMARWRAAAAV